MVQYEYGVKLLARTKFSTAVNLAHTVLLGRSTYIELDTRPAEAVRLSTITEYENNAIQNQNKNFHGICLDIHLSNTPTG